MRPPTPTSKVDGHHFEAVEEDPLWRAIAPELARPCRQRKDYQDGDGTKKRGTCREPSIVALNRSASKSSPAQWWHYCARHSFGRWVENGTVYTWRLTEDGPA